jgi:hypothetical protein
VERLIPHAPGRARGVLRLLLTCAAVAALTALAACGDDDDSSSKLSAIEALTESQYTAIKRVYVARLPLDDLDDVAKPASKRTVRRVVAACEQLDSSDALLGAMKKACPVTAELFHTVPATSECRGRAGCIDAIETVVKAARRVVGANRESDRAINATRLPQGCKKSLLAAPETYAQATALARSLSIMARALKTSSPKDDARALRALEEASDEEEGPSQQENLNLLRRSCH